LLLPGGSLDSELDQQWISEAKRRRDEVRSGCVKPIPAEEVYNEIKWRTIAALLRP